MIGLYHKYTKTLLNRDISNKSRHTQEKSQSLIAEMECTDCRGKRLNQTALHLSDIQKLLKLFDLIVSRGNTLVVIEHNLDVIKQVDWIVDIGPDGGKNGGQVVFSGTAKEMFVSANTLTAESLRASCEN